MAQYKVLQDIEAEDKLLGPLSLRQFIYAAITIALGFIVFKLVVSPAWFLSFIFLPPMLFFGLLAAPLGGQQSSEIWLLAKIRFFLMPRKRVWDQTGLKDLVTITVPKKIEKQLTKGYSKDEVKSRLRSLSATLDTRGWAIKNSGNMTGYTFSGQDTSGDRLFDISEQSQPSIITEPTADIFDPSENPRAQNMDQLINASAQKHRQAIDENLRKHSQEVSTLPLPQTPDITEKDEQELLKKLHASQAQPDLSNTNMKIIQPLSAKNTTQANPPLTNTTLQTHQKNQSTLVNQDSSNATSSTTQQSISRTVTPTTNPAILNIVDNSDGLSIKTIAGEAKRVKDRDNDDEVVISLH